MSGSLYDFINAVFGPNVSKYMRPATPEEKHPTNVNKGNQGRGFVGPVQTFQPGDRSPYGKGGKVGSDGQTVTNNQSYGNSNPTNADGYKLLIDDNRELPYPALEYDAERKAFKKKDSDKPGPEKDAHETSDSGYMNPMGAEYNVDNSINMPAAALQQYSRYDMAIPLNGKQAEAVAAYNAAVPRNADLPVAQNGAYAEVIAKGGTPEEAQAAQDAADVKNAARSTKLSDMRQQVESYDASNVTNGTFDTSKQTTDTAASGGSALKNSGSSSAKAIDYEAIYGPNDDGVNALADYLRVARGGKDASTPWNELDDKARAKALKDANIADFIENGSIDDWRKFVTSDAGKYYYRDEDYYKNGKFDEKAFEKDFNKNEESNMNDYLASYGNGSINEQLANILANYLYDSEGANLTTALSDKNLMNINDTQGMGGSAGDQIVAAMTRQLLRNSASDGKYNGAQTNDEATQNAIYRLMGAYNNSMGKVGWDAANFTANEGGNDATGEDADNFRKLLGANAQVGNAKK